MVQVTTRWLRATVVVSNADNIWPEIFLRSFERVFIRLLMSKVFKRFKSEAHP